MKLKLHPILKEMKMFYQQPPSPMRFKRYLDKLQGGSKGDLKLAISGYNPMAQDHILEKLTELENLGAEQIVSDVLEEFNKKNASNNSEEIEIVLNLADDLKGGWTNKFTTDFDSKFKINALATRAYCAPFFWSSESYSRALIRERTLQYAYRTLYWLKYGRLKTLQDHFKQELFVHRSIEGLQEVNAERDFELLLKFYEENKLSDDYPLIFNFFYGDKVSNSLSYRAFGIGELTGFDLASWSHFR